MDYRYKLITDDSGHWYVCNSERGEAAEKWLAESDGAPCPDWIHPLGGSPCAMTFTDPMIFGESLRDKNEW